MLEHAGLLKGQLKRLFSFSFYLEPPKQEQTVLLECSHSTHEKMTCINYIFSGMFKIHFFP